MSGLSLKYIRKTYGDIRAVDNVSLDFAEGGLTALLGPSGCGKTYTFAHDRRARGPVRRVDFAG